MASHICRKSFYLKSEAKSKRPYGAWRRDADLSSRSSRKKNFLVLDDVDNVDQLHALAKETSWFGPGSRIIITTRDFGLLYSFGVRLLYRVSFLDDNDAIKVFKHVAFDGGQPPSDVYHQFSVRASRLAQGLPSALEAFGALGILETVPQKRIKDILKTSYDGLDEEEQAAFLHVACLFNGDSVHRVNALIDDGDMRIKALEVKSLIDISLDGCITLHVLIEQAAREIDTAMVEGVALHMCEMIHVLPIDGNILNTINNLKFFKAFTHIEVMNSKLQFLPDTANNSGGLGQLRRLDVTGSKNLREIPDLSRTMLLEELIMKGCTRLEKTLERRRQIILRLPRGVKKLSSLANLSIEGKIHIGLWHLTGTVEHLSFISEQKIPDELVMVPKKRFPIISSFYDLKSLSIMRFSHIADGTPFRCISFSGFQCLVELNLINLNIQKIPDNIGLMQSLEKVDLSGNDFRNLPASTKNLSKLKYARLSNCIKLEAFVELTELQTLKLSGCTNLESLLELPYAVQDVGRFCLLALELDNCKNLQALSEQLSHFSNLIHLDLSSHDFEKLKSVEELPLNLKHLYAHGCDSLESVDLSPKHSIKHLDLSHCFGLQQDEQHITQFLNDKCSQEVSQRFLCLPGTEVPRNFDNQSHGTSTKISLFTPTLLSFAACILISCERSFYLQFPAFSYDWNRKDDEVISINLTPNLNLSSEIEEEETVTSHHLVIIHVPSSINTNKIEDLRLESSLQFPEEFQFSPCEIRAYGIRMVDEETKCLECHYLRKSNQECHSSNSQFLSN
ncbi:putative 17-beta-estradiol 17-dehydrogenase [Arabidopsis thaliana]